VIAVSRGHEPPAALGLQVVLAHHRGLVVNSKKVRRLMAKLGADAAVAIGLKLIADRRHSRHDLPIIGLHRWGVVIG
jgi:hypothetical protein